MPLGLSVQYPLVRICSTTGFERAVALGMSVQCVVSDSAVRLDLIVQCH